MYSTRRKTDRQTDRQTAMYQRRNNTQTNRCDGLLDLILWEGGMTVDVMVVMFC